MKTGGFFLLKLVKYSLGFAKIYDLSLTKKLPDKMILIWYHYGDVKLITRDTDYAMRDLLEEKN